MTLEEPPNEASASVPLDAELRRDLLKSLGGFLPALLIVLANDWLKVRFVSQPAGALWIIIPGLAVVCAFYVTKKTRQKLRLGWPFVVFLSVYLLVFVVAGESRLFDWQRTLVGYEDVKPGNVLALNRFGDWHYRFVSEKPNEDLAVVLMQRAPSIEVGRLRIAELIERARCWGAKGVALDFHFSQTDETGAELNAQLCNAIKQADVPDETECAPCISAGEMPVFVGYDFLWDGEEVRREPIDNALNVCLPPSRQGHAAGYREWDNKMRAIPRHLGRDRSLKSLSLVVAEHLASPSNQQLEGAQQDLLQFTKPAGNFRIIDWDTVWNNYKTGDCQKLVEDRANFQDRFILVGSTKDVDGFDSPYGFQPGVMIHAYAVHSLRQNWFIRRPGWRTTLPTITLVCYVLMFLMSRGASTSRLLVTSVAFSAIVVAVAIVSMRFWLTWIDVAYPLIAIWLFLLLLLGLRRIRLKKPSPGNATKSPSQRP